MLAGSVFALLTFIRVVVAKPRCRAHALRDDWPWAAVYDVPPLITHWSPR
jgi:hypothetical protein